MLVLELFLRVLSFVGHNFEIDPNLLSYSFLEHGSDPPPPPRGSCEKPMFDIERSIINCECLQ